ncbi:DUF3710 domain-containing protein, partial [Pseudonocardia sp. KRD291]|uniref:DUF3710 domain-containing protein n=1 Tax=Pseudonocardia sp. KRD291 TaxID=2792007 RepID=UPI001C4A2F4F
MFDVRPETDTGEELYPGYPGYDETAEPGDVYDDHDSRERESTPLRGPGRDGPRNGPGPVGPRGARPGATGRGPAPYRDDRYADDRYDRGDGGRYDDEPLYARDYAPQGHDFGDPDDDPRHRPTNGRPANGRAAVRPAPPARDDRYEEYDADEHDALDDHDDADDYDAPDRDDPDRDDAPDEVGYDDDEYGVGDAPLSVPPPGRDGRPLGPADVEELDPSMTDALARVDLGSMQVPVPYGAELKLEPTDGGRPQAVHLMLPEGRIAVSALAAPRSSGLWRELSAEIEASLRNGGARVRNAQGDWGRELHARTENAASVFIGADGPRWMVYGVATASLETVDALDVELRRVMRGVIVVRGKLPYPPRTVLPLTLPEHLADEQPEAAKPKGASIT